MPGSPPLPPLVLASASPRRKDLLATLGLTFEVLPPDVDEAIAAGEEPQRLVARLAAAKAAAGGRSRPQALVIAADTVVVLDGEILGKPTGAEENLAFLERLSGRSHLVYTGHHLRFGGREAGRTVATRVTFRRLDEGTASRYAHGGEGSDKAGGYAIQGLGAALVAGIEGCYGNVVGLSLPTVVELAQELGVRLV